MELIVNIDGASRGNPGPGASAWVIKSKSGKMLLKGGEFFKKCTNNFAEFTALKIALLKSAQLGGKKLFVRSDSLLLVKQYAGEYKIKNPDLQLIMADIKQYAKKFTILSLVHVPREQNKEADAVCNEIMDDALKISPQKPSPARQYAGEQLELFDI
jgi:ribonuclease HI